MTEQETVIGVNEVAELNVLPGVGRYVQGKQSKFFVREVTNDAGVPTGGEFSGAGVHIQWQDGALKNPDGTWNPQNGAFIEDVLLAAKTRLEFFQNSQFKSRENALAITKIEEALHWLDHRTARRAELGVEGTHQV